MLLYIDCEDLFRPTSLIQDVLMKNVQQVCKHEVLSNLIFADLMQLDEVNRIDAT